MTQTTQMIYRFSQMKHPKSNPLLHWMKQAGEDIGPYVNANKSSHVFETRKSRLQFKWQTSEINRLVHIQRQQYLLY